MQELAPPDGAEKYSYARTGKFKLYAFGSVSMTLLIVGMWMFLYHNENAVYFFGPFAALITFYLIISFLVGIFSRPFDLDKHEDLVIPYRVHPEAFPWPSVDIFYAICGEEREVIEKALGYIVKLVEGYKGNATVYICDDSKNALGADLKAQFETPQAKIVHSRRPNLGHMKKAGNLKHAFEISKGEFIVIFDADFCPREDFLLETLPYMNHDPNLSVLQTPQYFTTDTHGTWVGKGAAYVQELFYRLIQVNRNHFGGSICVGTNALYRREALVPLGGTAQVPYSEDVRTGFRCLASGWNVGYIPINLAKGLCPETLPAYLLQQHRWSLGSISLFFSKEFWKADITFMQRICFLTGMMYYVTTGLAVIFGFFPAIYMLLFAPQYVVWWSIFFSLPSLIFGTMYQAMWSHHEWGFHAVLARHAGYYSHLFALYEYLTGNLTPWQASGVATKTQLYINFQKLCFYSSSVITAVVIFLVTMRSFQYGFLPFIPTVLFATYNYYVNMRILRDQI